MVFIQLPELAVDNVEVLVTEEVCDGVDIFLFVEEPKRRQEVGAPQFRHAKTTAPGTVHHVENSGYHLMKHIVKILVLS